MADNKTLKERYGIDLRDLEVGDKVKFSDGNVREVIRFKQMRTLYVYFDNGSYDKYFWSGERDGITSFFKGKDIKEIIKNRKGKKNDKEN